jgi:hypothetical protein
MVVPSRSPFTVASSAVRVGAVATQASVSRQDKYWSPVGRVANAHGDRNLVCTCVPMEDQTAAA